MQLAQHTWMRPEPLAATLSRAKKLGYTSIELAGEPSQYPVASTLAQLKEHDMTCWGAVTIMSPGRDLIHPEPATRAAGVAYALGVVELSAALGGKIVTVVPSTVGKTRPLAGAEDEWSWAVEGLRSIAQAAAAKGLKVALEPLNRFETYFVNRVGQAVALIDAVGEANVGIAFDPFHLWMEEPDVYASVEACGRTADGKTRIFDVHLGDSNRLAPGSGAIDWPRLVGKLKEVGYEGALAMEAMPPVDRSPLGGKEGVWAQLETDPEVLEEVDPGMLQFLYDHASGVLTDEYYTALLKQTADVIVPLM
ncbi:xylose isomerase-like protein [Polychaeton citri CBS 116435]|uniref:Xylose isomerase-like protein n=1 Tax=Polychaeton citri CBS 116435 TaxID=1314669 RepID=A0A9P4Q2C6_9PEZI|nr:xylose isomerase-like protein [Polychaeton citri CBS 116435]